MSEALGFAAVGCIVFTLGLVGLLASRHVLRRVLALNLVNSGACIALVAIAQRVPSSVPDPVPHALVLTGIVVTVSATAVALALMRRAAAERSGAHQRLDGEA